MFSTCGCSSCVHLCSLLIHLYLVFWVFWHVSFYCCLRNVCQMSNVNSYVVEFGYDISFLGFLYSVLLHGFFGFLTPIVCIFSWFSFMLAGLILHSLWFSYFFGFCMLFENCVSIPVLMILFVSGLTIYPIFSAWGLSLLDFQLMNFHQIALSTPLLYLFGIVVIKLFQFELIDGVLIAFCFSLKEGRWLLLSQPCLQLGPLLRLEAV